MSIPASVARQAGFIPDVWCMEGLRVLRAKLNLAGFVARDTDFNNPSSVGQTINVPYPGIFTAPKKAAGSSVTTQRPIGGSTVSVTLNTHRATDFMVEDVARAQANPDLLRRYINPAMIALAEAVEQDMVAVLMQATNTLGTAGTDLTDTVARNANRDLNARKLDQDPMTRMLLMSPKDEAALLGSTNLANYLAWQRSANIESGQVNGPPIYGMTPRMSQLCPQTGVYRLTFTGGTNATTFRILFAGFSTGDITFSTTAATLATNIQTALAALTEPIAMTGLVIVAGAGTGPWTADVTFSGAALRFGSTLTVITDGVGGTAYDGAATGAFTGTITTTNFALHKEAAIFVPRPFLPVPIGMGVEASQIDDPQSGLSLRVLYWYDGPNRGVRIGFDILYGVTRLRDIATIRVLA